MDRKFYLIYSKGQNNFVVGFDIMRNNSSSKDPKTSTFYLLTELLFRKLNCSLKNLTVLFPRLISTCIHSHLQPKGGDIYPRKGEMNCPASSSPSSTGPSPHLTVSTLFLHYFNGKKRFHFLFLFWDLTYKPTLVLFVRCQFRSVLPFLSAGYISCTTFTLTWLRSVVAGVPPPLPPFLITRLELLHAAQKW